MYFSIAILLGMAILINLLISFHYHVLDWAGQGRALHQAGAIDAALIFITAFFLVFSLKRFRQLDLEMQRRRQAEEALCRREENLSLITENMHDMIVLTDADFNISYASPSLKIGLGVDPDELKGKSIFEQVHPEDLPRVMGAVKKALTNKTGAREVFRYRHADGRYLWLETTGSLLLDGNGEITGAVFANRDITDRKRAEDDLRLSETRYRAIVEDQTELICRFLPDGTLTFVNQAYCRYFNKRWEELVSNSVLPFIPEEDREGYMAHIASLDIEKPVATVEHRVTAPDGSVRWQQWTDRAFFNQDGLIQEFQSVGRDITERKLIEEKLKKAYEELEMRVEERTLDLVRVNGVLQAENNERRRAEAALRESEERFRSAFKYAAVGMALVGINGAWLQVNRSLCEMLGYQEQDLVNSDFQSITCPEDIEKDYECIQRLLKGEARFCQYEKKYFHKQGHIIWVWLSASLVRDHESNPMYFIAQVQDITQRKQAELELAQAREKAWQAERLASLGTMAAGIAHEISQPLSTLKIIVDMLLFWDEKGKTVQHGEVIQRLREISGQSNRIENIVRRIRSFVRNMKNPDLGPCSLNGAVEGALDMIGGQLRANGIRVETSLPSGLPDVLADRYRLEEVVINLVVNAMQAFKEVRKKDREILISASMKDKVTLEISDNATGIPDDFRDKIFDPFFSTKQAGEGMGLGLSIAHSIIISFGGTIQVSNNEKGGVTFTVNFPAYQPLN